MEKAGVLRGLRPPCSGGREIRGIEKRTPRSDEAPAKVDPGAVVQNAMMRIHNGTVHFSRMGVKRLRRNIEAQY